MTTLFNLLDIDECANSSSHNCSEHHNEICLNMEGSHRCDCRAGFDRNEGICEGNAYCGICHQQ